MAGQLEGTFANRGVLLEKGHRTLGLVPLPNRDGQSEPTPPVSSLDIGSAFPLPPFDGKLSSFNQEGSAIGVTYEEGPAFYSRSETSPTWVSLAAPGPGYGAARIFVAEDSALVAWAKPTPTGPSVMKLWFYIEREPMFEVEGWPTLCGDVLDKGHLELLAWPENGVVLHRISWGAQGSDTNALDVPLDEPWCVDASGESVVVAGRRGKSAAVALHARGRWTVRDLEPARSKLKVAFDGERVLAGSAESELSPHGMAYLLRVRKDGSLSGPLVLPSRHTEEPTTLFGRFVALVPSGPALVGWMGTSWWWPGGSRPGFRVYYEPCR